MQEHVQEVHRGWPHPSRAPVQARELRSRRRRLLLGPAVTILSSLPSLRSVPRLPDLTVELLLLPPLLLTADAAVRASRAAPLLIVACSSSCRQRYPVARPPTRPASPGRRRP
ncbi:hypothetical protein ZWY2020_013397 [Hordeum vulgare]|nr:hypothetical protein ZWY2020_013397 [Hordeum vulgare]